MGKRKGGTGSLRNKIERPKDCENMLRGEDVLDDTEMFVILLDSNYTFIIRFPVKSALYSPAEFFTYCTHTYREKKNKSSRKRMTAYTWGRIKKVLFVHSKGHKNTE